MATIFQEIQESFSIRNSAEQKTAFRAWVCETLHEAGWSAEVQISGKHHNVVIGDPEKAHVVFTAHYDTPKGGFIPNLMLPTCRPLFYAYQFVVVLLLLAPAIAAAMAAFEWVPLDYSLARNRMIPLLCYFVIYYSLFLLCFRAFVNKHNANDNTSGTAVVLETALTLPQELRSKAAFILFDDEEKGKLGSKAYAKDHPQIKLNTPVINFDCVGYGSNFILICKKDAMQDACIKTLQSTFSELPHSRIVSDRQGKANSDQANFDKGCAVVACKKSKRGILYVDRIHTVRDTIVDEENIKKLQRMNLCLTEQL